MTSLKKYIKDNSNILKNRDKTQGVLSDFFSGDTITVKRLMKGYDNGIIDVLNEENVDEDTKNRFVYKLVRKEDLIQDVAIEIFDEWAVLLGKKSTRHNKFIIINQDVKTGSDDKAINFKNNSLDGNERKQFNLINETLNNDLTKYGNYKKLSNDGKIEIIKSQSIKAIISNNAIMKYIDYIFVISCVVATVTSALVLIAYKVRLNTITKVIKAAIKTIFGL